MEGASSSGAALTAPPAPQLHSGAAQEAAPSFGRGGDAGQGATSIIKLLLPDTAVSVLIGRQGSNRSAIQSTYGVRIQCSRVGDFYPGTQLRVVWLFGPALSSTLPALNAILKLVASESSAALQLVIPSGVAGVAIGLGGQVQRDLCAQSGALIKFAPVEKGQSRLNNERLVTITGTRSAVCDACSLLLSKVADLPAYAAAGLESGAAAAAAAAAATSAAQAVAKVAASQYQQTPTPTLLAPQPPAMPIVQAMQVTQHTLLPTFSTAILYSTPPGGGPGPSAPIHASYAPAASVPTHSPHPLVSAGLPSTSTAAFTEVTLEVPDNRIGIIIGKEGSTLEGLKRLLSVRITVSRRDPSLAATAGDNMTAMRCVTISGAPADVASAQYVIMQKLQAFGTKRGRNPQQPQQQPQQHVQHVQYVGARGMPMGAAPGIFSQPWPTG